MSQFWNEVPLVWCKVMLNVLEGDALGKYDAIKNHFVQKIEIKCKDFNFDFGSLPF